MFKICETNSNNRQQSIARALTNFTLVLAAYGLANAAVDLASLII